jgi:hypothetical protein
MAQEVTCIWEAIYLNAGLEIGVLLCFLQFLHANQHLRVGHSHFISYLFQLFTNPTTRRYRGWDTDSVVVRTTDSIRATQLKIDNWPNSSEALQLPPRRERGQPLQRWSDQFYWPWDRSRPKGPILVAAADGDDEYRSRSQDTKEQVLHISWCEGARPEWKPQCTAVPLITSWHSWPWGLSKSQTLCVRRPIPEVHLCF